MFLPPPGVSLYATASGTSQAAPYVSSVVALMLSARPGSTYDTTKSVSLSTTQRETLMASGYTCGNTADYDVSNNQYGNGRIDAFAAVNTILGVAPAPSPKPSPIPTDRCLGLIELFCGEFVRVD